MKILFSALHFAGFRNFESVIRSLAARGHSVHLVADEPETFGGQALVERLAAEYPQVTWGPSPSPAHEAWFPAAQKLRFALDYVRFLAPRYADAPKLRMRNVQRAPRIVRWLLPVLGYRGVESALKRLERLMPRSPVVERFIDERAPDVVLLTALTFSRSLQMEQLKAARTRGIPVAACIMSWDHLSSKALLHIQPDMTLVWNPVQQQEAVDMHGLPRDRVVVTGAQCYDQWFDRRPVRTREEFCRTVGLDPARPFVLYVCSTMSPVPEPIEPLFVKRWVEAVRSTPALRDVGVLIRPHPERIKEWHGITIDGLENVVVHGRTPIDSEAKADYFDSLYFSEAVVGLCTSAFLEAAIVGRRVLTMLLPEYRIHQDGMAHFRYLLNVEGGLLQTASDLGSHLEQLATAVYAGAGRDARNVRFLTAFVRPEGLDVPATPAFIDAVEQLGLEGRRAPEPTLTSGAVSRRLVGHLAVAANHGVGRWLMMDAIDIERADSEREYERQKRQLLESRTAAREEEVRERDAAIRAKAAQRRVKGWKKWRRGLSARKQVARFKGGVKQLIGARHQ